MDSIFLDIDEYNPEELFDLNDKFNINENVLRERLRDKLSILNRLL
ncbi:colicin immunity domain-containing protein [Solitalea canadensis]